MLFPINILPPNYVKITSNRNKEIQTNRCIPLLLMERVARIELALSGRKHDILPLNYTRILNLSISFYTQLVKF